VCRSTIWEDHHGWDSIRPRSRDHQWVESIRIDGAAADFEVELSGLIKPTSGDFVL
jgi:hypothetical protein